MKALVSTIITVALLLGLGALAVLARSGGQAPLAPAAVVAAPAAPVAFQGAAGPDGPGQGGGANSIVAQEASSASSPEASRTGFNWLTLPLSNSALSMASDLRDDIQSSTGKTVDAIQKWNAVAQSFDTYAPLPPPLPSGDFALQVGGVYRISISGGGVGVTWSIVGEVPEATAFTYTLYETATSDLNWVMLPLDKTDVTMASQLKADIEAHSSGAATVLAVEGWNATAQSYQTYAPLPPPLPNGDFAVSIGYPYRVTIDVTSSATVVWPVR